MSCENEFNGLFVLSFTCLSQGSGSEMKREERERARERQTSRQGRKHRKSLVPPKAFIVLLFITISCLSSNFSVYSHRIFVPSRPGRYSCLSLFLLPVYAVRCLLLYALIFRLVSRYVSW